MILWLNCFLPEECRSDNGPEFISKAIQRWLSQLEINSLYIEPGAPWENGYAESFNSRFRDEFLAVEEFESLLTARRLTVAWWEDYNGQRPHSSLGYVTPAEFASRCAVSSRLGEFLPRASHRTGLVGPHPALQADYLKTTRVASWPPWGETRASGFADLPGVSIRFVNAEACTTLPVTTDSVGRFPGQPLGNAAT